MRKRYVTGEAVVGHLLQLEVAMRKAVQVYAQGRERGWTNDTYRNRRRILLE